MKTGSQERQSSVESDEDGSRMVNTVAVGGCLLKDYLYVRRRSIFRSESQDSGCGFEHYEAFSPSFDAEKFLEGLGFAGFSYSLIPERFIPSLIHRISNFSDETMKKLDPRVWKSIDSFKKKEHMARFFTNSGAVCDLCTESVKGSFLQVPCGASCLGSVECALKDSRTGVEFQNWLSPLGSIRSNPDQACSKANIGHIGNQSSTESGFLSMLGDETLHCETSFEDDSYSDICSPNAFNAGPRFLEDLHIPEISPTSELFDLELSGVPETRSNQTFQGSCFSTPFSTDLVHDLDTINSTAAANYKCEYVPNESSCVSSKQKLPPVPSKDNREIKCVLANQKADESIRLNNVSHLHDSERSSCVQTGLKSIGQSGPAVVVESFTKLETIPHSCSAGCDETSMDLKRPVKKHPLKKMSTDGQLFLLLSDVTDTKKDDTCCIPECDSSQDLTNSNAELTDTSQNIDSPKPTTWRNRSTIQTENSSSLPAMRKRHSFDSVYCSSAAEKRKLFKLTNLGSHRFVFETDEHNFDSILPGNEALSREKTLNDSVFQCNSPSESQSRRFVDSYCLQPQEKPRQTKSSLRGNEEKGQYKVPVTKDVELVDSCCGGSMTSDELSEQYFSCDDQWDIEDESSAKGACDLIEHKYAQMSATNEEDFVSGSTRLPNGKVAPQIFSISSGLPHDDGKSFMLDKILKRNLNFSLPESPLEVRRDFAEIGGVGIRWEDREALPRRLNNWDRLLDSELLEQRAQSPTDSEGYHPLGALLKIGRSKYHDKAMTDKTTRCDNMHFSPFVCKVSLQPEAMSKCEVRLFKSAPLSLFWPSRNGKTVSRLIDSVMDIKSESTTSGTRYTNGQKIIVNSENSRENSPSKVYSSEVFLEVNGEDEEKRLQSINLEKKASSELREKAEEQPLENQISKTSTHHAESPCSKALKDLEDLRSAIQKAKATRMSASRELKLLQDLLQCDENEDNHVTVPKTSSTAEEASPRVSSDLADASFDRSVTNDQRNKALSELQQKSAKDALQNKEFLEEEIKKAREEINEACQQKINVMEEKLRVNEEKLVKAEKENERLKSQLELRNSMTTTAHCKCHPQESDFSHMNGRVSDEESPKTGTVPKPTTPAKDFWQEWDRLHSDLMNAERKADQLNLLLNQKLIELNKMQLTLSKQTKEMILLEKAYFQLRSHMVKRKVQKSCGSSSQGRETPTNEAGSELSCKTSDLDTST